MFRIILSISIFCVLSIGATAQTTAFTYQGKLTDAGSPTANYDFEFRLWDAITGGNLLATQSHANVPVTNGLFSVKIDLSGSFSSGATRYLEIGVKNAGAPAFTTLSPRQEVTSAPYNIRSLSAANADQLGGINPGGFVRNTSSPQPVDLTLVGNAFLSGNLGLGSGGALSPLRLDVRGRSRFGQNFNDTGVTNSAGFWLFQNSQLNDRAFVGMQDDNYVGFYGNIGGGWGLTMNVTNGNVGIGTTPNDRLDVNGFVRFSAVGPAGNLQLCRNASNQISICSSSLRYKTNISPFFSGLYFIRQLRPITFDWIQDGMRDVGFAAEDVAQIDPLFVTYNDKGQVEGVKYDRLSVVLVNAIKEQQVDMESLRSENKQQQQRIDALTNLVCSLRPRAAACRGRR